MRSTHLIPVAVLAFAAACSDTATSPTSVGKPQFVTVFNSSTAPNGAHYAARSSEPVCTISGLTISCTGTQINGVGNTNADLLIEVTYTATVRCRNHGGKIVDVKTQVVDDGAVDTDLAPKNGNLQVPSIDISAAEAPSNADFEAQATCPNPNWTKSLLGGSATIDSFTYTLTFVGFTAAVITVEG
jgi:hypothetical protein